MINSGLGHSSAGTQNTVTLLGQRNGQERRENNDFTVEKCLVETILTEPDYSGNNHNNFAHQQGAQMNNTANNNMQGHARNIQGDIILEGFVVDPNHSMNVQNGVPNKKPRTYPNPEGFQCDLCPYKAKMKSHLRAHRQSVHEGIKYPCEHCDYKATAMGSLRRHYNALHSGIKYRCGECEHVSNTPSNLKYHHNTVHMGLRYPCAECSHVSNTRANLKYHHNIVHLGLRFPCDKCDYKATTVSHLKKHRESVHEGVKYKCNECDHESTTKESLKVHKRSLHKKFLYPCPKCDYVAKVSSHIKQHVRSVHDKIRFPCDKCDYSAINNSRLKHHKETVHSGLRFTCDEHAIPITTARQLRQIMREDVKFECLSCEMVARESMEVLRRQKIVKTENDIDSDTDEYDSWGGALMPVPNSNRKKKKDLKKVSNLQCEICYHEARNSAELKQHVLAMHDHTMYQCTFCPFKTSHQSSLKRHKQTVHPLAELKVYCDTCINTGAQMPPKAENKEELRRILELADALQCQDCKSVSRRSLELIKFHEENPKSQGQDQIISIQKGRLACDMCGYDGRNFNDLKQHKLTVHEGVSYNCELCDYVAARPEALKRHRKTRHEERKFMCDHCNFRAHTAVKLSQHKLTAHVGVRYPCNQCNYSSARPNKLKEHKLMFHNGNEGNGFQCDECNKVFPDVTMLKKHKQDHNRVTPQFQCQHCGFNTEQVQQLQNHIDSVHRRGMPGNQQCPNCQYQCMDPVELHKHMNKVHGGRRSVNLAQQGQNVQIATVTLGCEHCSFKCLSAQELQQHLEGTHNISSQAVAQSLQAAANQAALQAAVHQAAAQAVANQAAGIQGQQNQQNQINLNVARTYSCQKCNYKVDSLENIQSHVKLQHGESDPKFIMAKGEIQFACGECNFVSNTEEVLLQHKASSHENEGYPRDLSNHQVRGMNQQQAHQVRTMNVATTAAAHNRVTQHDKDKAKMFVNQQEYDQAALTGILTSSFRGQIPVANMPGGFTTYSIHTPGALPTYQIVGGQTISVPTVSASQNQAVLTAASAAASSSVQTLVAAAAGQHADGQVSATTSNVARVSGYQWGAPNWYDAK